MNIKIISFLPDNRNFQLPFYASENYLSSVSNNYGWITNDLGNIYLPYYVKVKLIFKYAVITDKPYCTKNIDEFELKIFLNNSISFLKKNMGIDYIPPTPNHSPFKILPDNVVFAKFGTFIINLKESVEVIFNKFHLKHKNAIKKAVKDDIKIIIDHNNFNIFYDLYVQTMERSNMPITSKEILYKIFKENSRNTICGVAFLNNLPQAACLIFFDNKYAYYTYGATISKPSQGASNLLQFEVIKFLKNINCEEYNLVGARINPPQNSKYYSIQQYKERFGAVLEDGYLWKAYLSKKSFLLKILKLFNIIKPDIIDQEK